MKKWILIILGCWFAFTSCVTDRPSSQENEWSIVEITSIEPAWKGTTRMCVIWTDGKKVEHPEYTDTAGLHYYIGLTRPSLIKK